MIHNPSNLYSGGNVVLDSTPYMRIAAQQRARKQSIDEASFRHYSQLPDKLNSAGVRDQDWEDPNGNGGIGQDIESTKSYFLQNSADIIKGGKASIMYSKMMQDNMRKIQSSKDIAKDQLKTGQEVLKPNGWKPRPSDTPIIHNMDLSMYDPSSKKEDGSRYGMHDLSLASVPYTPERESAFQKNVFNGITAQLDEGTKPIIDDVSGKMYNTYKHKPADIIKVGENAAQMVASDKTMSYHYEDLLTDHNAVKIASEMLSKVSGVQVEATTPQQLAAGLAMYKAENFTSQKEETNQALVQKRKLQLQREREAERLKRLSITEAGKNARVNQLMDGGSVGHPLDEIAEKDAIKHPIVGADNTSMGTSNRVYESSMSTGDLNMYNKPSKDRSGRLVREVEPFIDPITQEKYYNVIENADGHKEFSGQNGKIGADVARERKINAIPSNKTKQAIYFNGKAATETKKTVGASKIHWK